MTTPAIAASGVVVRYGEVTAVAGVDLAVEAGQVVAVTGPSGAGKSSLLAALAGLRPPAAGEVHVGGAPLRDHDDAVEHGVVIVPQGNGLVRVLTAAENVAVAVLGRRDDVDDVVAAALAAVGLDGAAGQLVEELSGGQQQRLAVARGLAQRGKVVLADEPTSELDAGNRERVVALLRAEAERGAAVVFATHDPDGAAACDAELRLDDGVASWVRR
ncbi:ABC transporter ATP-binding protein [Jatrophihabitans sp. YIM 134969]